MVSNRRKVFAAGAALAALVIAFGVYFNNGTGAREKKNAARDPAAVPVVVTPAIMQSTPVRLAAIGNAEPLATVGVKARVDGQIIEINFKEGGRVVELEKRNGNANGTRNGTRNGNDGAPHA